MSPDAATPHGDRADTPAAAAEERDRAADDREAALAVRESRADAVLAAERDRKTAVRRILDDAERRDEVSDARDTDADDREVAASRAAFLDQRSRGVQPEVRRAAALDRIHSKSDRSSAATDRSELAGEDAAIQDE